jgi:hypothetical protein
MLYEKGDSPCPVVVQITFKRQNVTKSIIFAKLRLTRYKMYLKVLIVEVYVDIWCKQNCCFIETDNQNDLQLIVNEERESFYES